MNERMRTTVLAKPFVPSFTAPPASPPVAQEKEDEATHEPESEDIKDTVVSAVASVTETSTATESTVSTVVAVTTVTTVVTTEVEQTDVVAEDDEVTMTATSTTAATTTTTETETVVVEATTKVTVATQETKSAAAVEAEQAAIGERIVYSIARLLELEPELCPVPPSVLGLPVAAETTGKASQTISTETLVKGGGRGGNGLRRGDSSRSLTRSNSSTYNENSGGGGGRGNGTRRGGRGGRGHNVHDTAPALEDCAPLAINEATRWKPSHSKSRQDGAQEATITTEEATAASLKEARSLLNKLSIEKFEKLSNELIAVAVRHVDVLTGVIETIIQKAKMEWHFSTMYGELCTKMARTQMPAVVAGDNGEVVEDTHKLFRHLLLKRCEQEFNDAPSRDGWEFLSPDDLAEKELILKRGVLGHIRFVGELFKLRMLKARIMHHCIANLFGDATTTTTDGSPLDEEALECLVNLLTTIGQAFEANASSDSERQAIAQYYATIKTLAQDAARLSTRVRFMLQDLLDLRKNKWVARRKETKAMTIAEVHAEAKREADEKARASGSHGTGSGSGNGPRLQRSHSMNAASDKLRRAATVGGGGGASDAWKARAAGGSSGSSVSSAVATPTVDADGWETVASGKAQKLLKPRSNSDRFLAPSPSSSIAVGRPPKSGTTATVAPSRSNSSVQKEAMSAAASLSSSRSGSRRDRDRTGSSSSSSSSVGGSFSALRRGSSMSDLGRPPVSSSSSSHAKSASTSSSESEEATTTKTSTPTKTATLSAEAFEKKVKSILDEYVAMRDLDEAVACFADLATAHHHARIATQSLNVGLEKGDKERAAVASFLAGLHARGVVSTEDLAAPLQELLEVAEDLEIDIPRTLQYIAEMVAPSVASGAVPLVRIVASVQHLAPSGKAATVVAQTLAGVRDDARVQQLVTDAALDFRPLLADAQRTDEGVRTFLSDAKLAFLVPV